MVQDKNPKPVSSSGPPLVIKLPSQTDQIAEKNSVPLESPDEPNGSSAEEEDDWDTFQSFPASGNETAPTPERPSILVSSSGSNDYKGHSYSVSLSNEESLSIEDHELGEAVSEIHVSDSGNQMEECHGPADGGNGGQQTDDIVSGLAEDELFPNTQSNQFGEENIEPFADYLKEREMVSNDENNQPLSDVQHIHSTEVHDGRFDNYEQGFPDPQPIKAPAEISEPSTEHYHKDTDTLDHGSILQINEEERPSVSPNEATSIIEDSDLEHHGRTTGTHGSSLSNTIDIEDDNRKLPGNSSNDELEHGNKKLANN